MPTLYQKNRQKLMDRISDGLIVVSSPRETIRNGDVSYKFRQDSYFLYLTGIDKPEHTLVLDPKKRKTFLFIPDIDDIHRLWVGKQQNTVEAKKIHKTDFVYHAADLDRVLNQLSKKYTKSYLLPQRPLYAKKFPKRLKKDLSRLTKVLDNLRLIKEPEEIEFMRQANRITGQAFLKTMRATTAGLTENQIQAVLESEFLKSGAHHTAYNTIVAAGSHASILHYVENNAPCHLHDLLLIDGGCEWRGYASDVTRTYPISGRFTDKQREIYEIALAAKKQCTAMVRPGVTLLDIHIHACKTILKGLINVGIIKNESVDMLYEKEIHRVFFPHGIGHLLGLDVHDVGARPNKKTKQKAKNLRNSLKLEEGMVVTIEPGIYFIEIFFDAAQKRKKYSHYINWKKADQYRSVGGIRIEDDILVTANGHKNLSTLPDGVSDIEKILNV